GLSGGQDRRRGHTHARRRHPAVHHRPPAWVRPAHPRTARRLHRLRRTAALGRRRMAATAARRPGHGQEEAGRRPQRRLGAGHHRPQGGQGHRQDRRPRKRAPRTSRTVAPQMTTPETPTSSSVTTPDGTDAHDITAPEGTARGAVSERTPQDIAEANRRQVLLWRLLARVFGAEEQPSLESASVAVVDDLGLPAQVLDPSVSVDNLVQRFPELGDEFRGLMTGDDERDRARTAALASKLLLNLFATGQGNVSATQLAAWQRDAGWFEQALGCQPGELRAQAGQDELGGMLAGLEGDLVRRMRLREVLKDPALARQLTPSMSLIEQLLRDKANLSGVALANAKALIRRYVDEVAQVLRTQVQQTSVGTVARSVPPRRVFRNLDLDRTIWKNLTTGNSEDEPLYVDRLFYRHTARRTTRARMIVVVDQSGSMVDSMVNCTILASIFAGLPRV